MVKVAVLVKTLGRTHSLIRCVESVLRYSGFPVRLYVADDGPVPPAKEALYEYLQRRGDVVTRLPANTGASESRNKLLGLMDGEPYILRMDDDFALSGETRLDRLAGLLEGDPELGVVGDLERQVGLGKSTFSGRINPGQGYLRRSGSVLHKDFIGLRGFKYVRRCGPSWSARIAFCGFTRNMLLIRPEVFESVGWDGDLKFEGEHLDFLLQLSDAGFKIGFTPDSVHEHRDDLNRVEGREVGEAQVDREASERAARGVLARKWGIESVEHNWPLRTKGMKALCRGVSYLGERVAY